MHAFYRVVTDEHGGVEAGEEIGITRLEKGHDTVQLTRYAYRDYGKKKAEPAASSDRSDTPETPEPATAPEADLGAILAEALSLKGQGEYAAAAAKYRKVIAADAANADAHWGLAWVLVAQGHSKQAVAEFESFMRVCEDEAKRQEAESAIERLQQ